MFGSGSFPTVSRRLCGIDLVFERCRLMRIAEDQAEEDWHSNVEWIMGGEAEDGHEKRGFSMADLEQWEAARVSFSPWCSQAS
eukprot:1330192-Rhodomonas_salina.3